MSSISSLPDTQCSLPTAGRSDSKDYQVDESCPYVETWSPPKLHSQLEPVTPEEQIDPPLPKLNKIPLNDTTENSDRNGKMSAASSKGESTQPFSQEFFELYTSPAKSRTIYDKRKFVEDEDTNTKKSSEDATNRAYETGQTGYVNLHSTKSAKEEARRDEEDDIESEDSDDDLEALQVSIPASQFPEDRRFQAPKTPASRGKKRAHNGDILHTPAPGSAPDSTPRLPVNPFTGHGLSKSNVMSLSQVFDATQAPSSPMLNVPTSDGLSDRPSPNMWNAAKPPIAIESSPAKLQEPPAKRSKTDPHTHYISMTASQEERERKRQESLHVMNTEHRPGSDGSFEDLLSPGSADIRRQYRRDADRLARASRSAFSQITAAVPGPERPHGRNATRKWQRLHDPGDLSSDELAAAPKRLESNSAPAHKQSAPQKKALPTDQEVENAQLLPSDSLTIIHSKAASEYDLDGDETQHGNSSDGRLQIDHPHTGVEDDKENAQLTSVQVPRTVARESRHIFIGAKHSKSTDDSLIRSTAVQAPAVAVANSQPVEPNVRVQAADKTEAFDGKNLSQTRVPDSTQLEPDTVKAQRMTDIGVPVACSQQTATPPSSSPSPQKNTSTKVLDVSGPESVRVQVQAAEDAHAVAPEDQLTSPTTPQKPGNVSRLPKRSFTGTNAAVANLPHTVSESEEATMRTTKVSSGQTSASSPSHGKRSVSTRISSQQTPKFDRLKPRKFNDIIPEHSPLGHSLDFDISALTNEDQLFKQTVGTSPDPSPIKPKRRKIPVQEISKQSVEAATRAVPSLTGPESSEMDTAAPFRRAQSPIRGKPFKELLSSLPSRQYSSEPERTGRQSWRARRPIIESSISTTNSSASSQNSPPANAISKKLPTSELQRKKRRLAETSETTSKMDVRSADLGESAINRSSDKKVVSPNQVWAWFNGSFAGFYPAICLGVADGNRLRVRFDNGMEDAVPLTSVKKLELRIGDSVKVDGGSGSRNQTFVIQELLDKASADSFSYQSNTFTDVHGWSKLRLAAKKDSQSASQTQSVQVRSLYLTKTLFNSLRGRDYMYCPTVLDELTALTPSAYTSAPGTPSSRQRRVKTSMKVESTLHSFRSNTNKQGIFAGMAFAITAVEKPKRPNLQSLITDHGGILLEGLDTIFEIPSEHLTQSSGQMQDLDFSVKTDFSSLGFTALITEKHGRTSNYLYALALNVPCISLCWIRDCVDQKRLLDWRSYLLPAGESQVLDGAISSRSVEMPPEFMPQHMRSHWPLKSMFDARLTPLRNQNVLIISSSGKDEKMSSIHFIACALGANKAGTVTGWKEADDQLRDKRVTWDWICAPDEAHSSKSRKRRSYVPDSSEGLGIGLKNGVKVIKPEFIVQSLMLGRLVNDA